MKTCIKDWFMVRLFRHKKIVSRLRSPHWRSCLKAIKPGLNKIWVKTSSCNRLLTGREIVPNNTATNVMSFTVMVDHAETGT